MAGEVSARGSERGASFPDELPEPGDSGKANGDSPARSDELSGKSIHRFEDERQRAWPEPGCEFLKKRRG